MTTEERVYKQELDILRGLIAKKDFSKHGKFEYIHQMESVQRAYWAMYRASVEEDTNRKNQKKAKGMK